jgi:hypothetical protein
MWRKSYDNITGGIDVVTVIAVFVALMLIAIMFWMATTGERFCCDSESLVRQLLRGRPE